VCSDEGMGGRFWEFIPVYYFVTYCTCWFSSGRYEAIKSCIIMFPAVIL
jgi:hypothetical protein